MRYDGVRSVVPCYCSEPSCPLTQLLALDENGLGILHYTCLYNFVPLVKALLEHGADPNALTQHVSSGLPWPLLCVRCKLRTMTGPKAAPLGCQPWPCNGSISAHRLRKRCFQCRQLRAETLSKV